MPRVEPLGGEVSWPVDEGVIGVVGVAPWATLDFLNALYSLVEAEKDWHFPRVLCDINTKLPSRGRHLELGERDPSPYIAESLRELNSQGATVAVVPCNTAHVLFDRWGEDAPLPVVHIVKATAQAMAGAGVKKAATLGSRSIWKGGAYDEAVRDQEIEAVRLSEAQAEAVFQAIEHVKVNGSLSDDLIARLRRLLDDVRNLGAEGIILGCTELAGVESLCRECGLEVVESNRELARGALIRVGMQARLRS